MGDYQRFQGLEAEILAISSDSLKSHHRFAEIMGGIDFPMLSDEEMEVIRQYGVVNDRGDGARRSIFILDMEGRLAYINPTYSVKDPAQYEAIFEVLQRI